MAGKKGGGKRAKLDGRTVMMVRDLRAAGVPEARLAAMAGVHAATVRQVVSGRTWGRWPKGDASRGASVLLSMPELLSARERLLVMAALDLLGAAKGEHYSLYRDAVGRTPPAWFVHGRRGPSQLAVDALSHPSRWRGDGAGGAAVEEAVLRGRCHANDRRLS